MDRWAGKVAVVTGASCGIGLATAQALVREGLTVVGLARRKEKMEESMKSVKGPGKFYAVNCDITSEKDIIAAFEWIKKTLGTVHILVNNAGALKQGSIEDTSSKDLEFVMNVNVMGLIHCSKQAIKLMKENGQEGHIINVNSIAGHKTPIVEGMYYNVYSATKFAVRSLSETLLHELTGAKIRVCNISPGLVRTEIFDAAKMDSTFLNILPALYAEDVAESIIHVIRVPVHVNITELTIKPLGERF